MVKALSYTKGPIKKIQGRSLDIYEVVDVIRNTQTDLRLLRSEESDFYQRCYDYAIRICNLIGIEPSMPRVTEKQVHRQNTPAGTPYDYYHVNVCSPFLEHLTEGIDQRFDKYNYMTLRLVGLVPSVIAVKDEVSIFEAIEFYKDDLPYPNLLDKEFRRWKNKWRTEIPSSRPNSVAKSLKVCDEDFFPNIYILLKLAATIPVTSCEYERSGSVLKRLNTYLRASMGQERLTSSAMIHINYDQKIDEEKVLEIFVRSSIESWN